MLGPVLPKNSIVWASPGQNQTRTNRPDDAMNFIGQMKLLLQLRVLGFGLLQDGNAGVGVFPKGKKVLVSGACPNSSRVSIRPLRSSRLQSIRPGYAQMRQSSSPPFADDSAVVKDSLKLGSGSTACPAASCASPRTYAGYRQERSRMNPICPNSMMGEAVKLVARAGCEGVSSDMGALLALIFSH